ncbi:MAG TPA: superoxide dismutase [Cu-Zn] SodC [Usitatibacter sp.]|nr:superoxide dismutase [Cu-Zn] SodC [Usitatibacter sp.]
MTYDLRLLLSGALATAGVAAADYHVTMNAIDAKGVGVAIGHVTISAAQQGGVLFTPDLKGLPPGAHGFHVHAFANCGARQKEGRIAPGEMAGGHYDPKKTGKHSGPQGEGHMGDLPVLKVDGLGAATEPVTASHLTLRRLRNKSLVIHQGGDNYSDMPQPLGGGGARIACGVIQAGER